MRNHSLRNGIVLTEICGVYLLIADQEARKHCPYIKEISETGAYIWKQMEQNKSPEEIISDIEEKYDVSDTTDLKTEINTFIQSLKEAGYIA